MQRVYTTLEALRGDGILLSEYIDIWRIDIIGRSERGTTWLATGRMAHAREEMGQLIRSKEGQNDQE